MKEFRNTNRGPKGLSIDTIKIYYTYLWFSLISYFFMIALSINRSGYTAESIEHYYKGNEELGKYGKSYGEMLDLTHFHLFSIPLFLLVLSHVYVLIGSKSWYRPFVVYGSFFSGLIYILSPWLIVYVNGNFSYGQIFFRIVFGICVVVMTIEPMRILSKKV